MSDQPISLRRDPGRDSTASDIAKSRGEFRRRPHVEGDHGEVAVPATAPVAKRAEIPAKPPQAHSSRLLH